MRITILLCIILMLFLFADGPVVIADSTLPIESPQKDYLLVYYFRGNFRCSNCYKIEKYTTEALLKFFAKKLESGELVYKIVNVDEKENTHFVDDYALYTKSVVVSWIKDGKEEEHKNLQKIWEYMDNKEKFYNYIKEEVSGFLSLSREKE